MVMASLEQKYFHDRTVLLIISISSFLTLLGGMMTLLRIDSGRSQSYTVEWRANLGISAFKMGSAYEIQAFALFMVATLLITTLLSYRVYKHHRQYAVAVLGLGLILTSAAVIVSNALLVQG